MTVDPYKLEREIVVNGASVQFRLANKADAKAIVGFAQSLSMHQLLFLPRDIRQPKVVAAWLDDSEAGQLRTLLAIKDGQVIGCGTVARDPMSWSAHIAEIRCVLAMSLRNQGFGTELVQETFRLALATGAEKVIAQMTTDQDAAIAIFRGLGFTPEAVFKDQVEDTDGVRHDILVLSQSVSQAASQLRAYGVGCES
ncbi:MAG: GNAT family protein [Parvibaculaceae bacterium]